MRAAHFKIEPDGTVKEQSIKTHLEETARLSEEYASKIHMPKTGRLLGLLHDAGKLSDRYRDYLFACRQYELGEIDQPPAKGSVDHGVFGAAYVMDKFHTTADRIRKMTAEMFAMVLAYHHGGLKDYLGPDTSTPLWDRIRNYRDDREEEYEAVKREFEKDFLPEKTEELFACAVGELGALRAAVPGFDRFQMHLTVKFLYSCLIDGDREDTRCFMEGSREPKRNTDWVHYEERLEKHLQTFQETSARTESEEHIRRLREEISEACCHAGDWPSGVYKLTVPTGGGKTLASMRMALRHIRQKEDAAQTGHIIQVLPMVSIIEQNAAAVRDALGCKDELLEHHSNVIVEPDGETENNLSKERYQLLTGRWDVPFVFTTIVQFLNTVYASGTQSIRRMHNLAHAVIVMDEVQALPLKTLKLFGSLVKFLRYACDTTIILSTATQPNLEQLPLGMKTDEVREIIPDVAAKFVRFQRMKIKDALKKNGYTVEEAVQYIREVKSDVKSLLVIMNTKAVTRAIYEALKKQLHEQTELLYITTDLCPSHRTDVIRRLKELLDQKKSVVCVSTNLLEAGVDISAESVVRNVAGLDSIAQSAGRGNRHGECAEQGILHIINVKEEHLGSLTEIRIGEEKAKAVLDTFRREPDAYGGSLLSPKAMADYFQKYFHAEHIENLMGYPINEDPELKELYRLFTGPGDKILRRRYQNRHFPYKYELTFPFETAANLFQVIETNTVSILVPYKMGTECIKRMIGAKGRYDIRKLRQELQKAKPYFVNLYTSNLQRYRDAVLASPIPGVLILKEGYYGEETGIKEEKELEFLSF